VVWPKVRRVFRGTRLRDVVPEDTLWKWWLGVGGTVVALYAVLPESTLSYVIYLALALSVPVAIAIGVRRFRPTPRAPWYWFISASCQLFGAEVIWFVLNWMGRSPYPSVADVLYLSVYPSLAVGLALLVRHRTAARELSSLLDAAIVTIGAGIVTWVLLVGPQLADVESTSLERVLAATYPVLDLLLFAVVARLAFSGGARRSALMMFTLGLVISVTTDVYFVFAELTDGYVVYGIPDSGWLLAYTLIGAAALHPSMAQLGMRAGEPSVRVTPLRLVTLTVASVTAPLILLLQWLRGAALEVPVVASARSRCSSWSSHACQNWAAWSRSPEPTAKPASDHWSTTPTTSSSCSTATASSPTPAQPSTASGTTAPPTSSTPPSPACSTPTTSTASPAASPSP
jgi:hypothetical protein